MDSRTTFASNPNVALHEKEAAASTGVNDFSLDLSEKEFRRMKYKKHNNSSSLLHKAYELSGANLSKNQKNQIISKYKQKIQKDYVKLYRDYIPHVGQDLPALEKVLDTLNELSGSSLSTKLLSRIENVILTAMALFECESITQATAILMLHFKTWYSGALLQDISRLIESTFTSSTEGLPEPHGSTSVAKPAWLIHLREAMTNWKLVTNNPVFSKISFLISVMITCGICEETTFQWNVNGIRVFHIAALERHMSCFDIVDAALDTVMYFVEAGWECFVTKSVSPLLYSDHRIREFDNDYIFLMQNLEHVKTGNLEKFGKITEQDFDEKLTKTTQTAKDLAAGARSSFEKKLFGDKVLYLSRMRATFDTVRVQGGLRIAPYCVEFYGTSGVGKSSISAITMAVGLISNGFKASDEYLVTLNEADKFMSNYKSNVNGVFIDDACNTKAQFVEKAPTQKVLEIMNNVRQYAMMAEADQKGKVSVSPMWCNLTTNVKGLDADVYSNNPVSIARRAHLVVTTRVKKPFAKQSTFAVESMLDPQKVEAFYTDEDGLVNIPLLPDIWELDVETVIPVPNPSKGRPDTIGYRVVEHKGKPLSGCSLREFLDFVIEDSRKHFASQKRLVERSKDLAGKFTVCEKCKRVTELCNCVEPHFGWVAGYTVGVAWEKFLERTTNYLHEHTNDIEIDCAKKLVKLCHDLETQAINRWVEFIPECWVHYAITRKLIEYSQSSHIVNTIRREMFTTLVFCAILLGFFGVLAIPFVAYFLLRIAFLTKIVKQRVYEDVLRRRGALNEVTRKTRDSFLPYFLGSAGVVFALYTAVKFYRGFRASQTPPQGNLQPAKAEDVAERDKETNPWKGAEVTQLPKKSPESSTATSEQILNRVKKNMFYMVMDGPNGKRFCNALAMNSNILLFPKHMWKDEVGSELTTVHGSLKHGKQEFKTLFSRANSIDIPDTDLSLVYVPQIGDRAAIYRFLPLEVPEQGPFLSSFMDRDGEFKDFYGHGTRGLVGHALQSFFGGKAEYNISTFSGLCMAPLISKSKGCQLIGFHLGGRTGTTSAVYGSLTMPQYYEALSELQSKPGVLRPIEEGNFKTSLYDVNFFQSTDVHYKSPANFIGTGPDTNYRVFGSVIGKVSPNSAVVPTIISPLVEKHFGIPQKWGKPKLKPAWKPWYDSLVHSASPSLGVGAELLQPAILDYIKPIKKIIVNNEYIRKDVKPLTRMQTVCGIDGKRFIDKMPAGTSVGFPLTGPKRDYLTPLPPDEYEDFAFPVELDEKFWNEVENVKECYRAEQRAYPVFKACTKDEPTKLTKDKVRIFQSAPLALQLLTRMYFLPVVRVLSIYPLISECAVGVNCQGPEWSQLNKHIEHFGKDRILAGDYSKYDLRMPAQLTTAAYTILIDLAKSSGNYTEDDLLIMTGIAHDICYPMIAYDGTLLEFIGTNPSGQSLTVYINSIVNSLLMRCAFHEVYPGVDFRSRAKMMTYGDDVKGSVSKDADLFNHLSYAEFLSRHDMVFTMPDKESTPTKYMHTDDADFLKRKNIWNPELGLHFGALDESSIYKSLHSVLQSSFLSPEQQATTNMDGALREWFSHGREIYEARRATLKNLCEEAKLVVPGCKVSYEERLQDWIEKYQPSTKE